MGKKKRKTIKVWCYYCEREFEDEKILVQHQKAKHFKCHVCHKKLSTAGGMVVHVLQVHKESITKVPNSKPERESTEIEIFGMEGIPAEILAAHDGDQFTADDDEKPTKIAKMDIPIPPLGGGLGYRPVVSGMPFQPVYTAMPPTYVPPTSMAPRPPTWPPLPPHPQPPGWSLPMAARPLVPSLPPRPPPQPLFPIQSANVPPSSLPTFVPRPLPQPLFPIQPPLPPVSIPPSVSVQQSPMLNGHPSGPNIVPSTPVPSLPVRPPPEFVSANEAVVTSGSAQSSSSFASGMGRSPFVGVPAVSPSTAHMYASGPNTDGPSIGPPPVISNKPPVSSGAANEVYLVWDDEAMTMEERRLSLPKYQVVDDTSQMTSIDAAIDKRIFESRLAGRMKFQT
ncbi:hypothetical protein O6H91_01G123700 [Diphasiastrum complanatum]|uniref:Uncharacterized protein n=1 Tax=Diphasiastrum complanatum TaxID=34168 RepID=A0ACC2EVL4_DIPCM|nr:hypothetical protein O6H91_01G123700 [Diphasiastrum complanatum]